MVLLPTFVSENLLELGEINKDLELGEIKRILLKCRGHLLLYGTIRKRILEGKGVHILNFGGAVSHTPIPNEISKLFSNEFASVIPRKLMLSTDGDAFAFETTSVWFDTSARYVMGVAYFLSGQVAYAEKLFIHVESQLKAAISLPPFYQTITQILPLRFKELYSDWLKSVHEQYFMTRDKRFLEKEDELATKLLERDPSNYFACLGKSITEFVLKRDIVKAKEFLHLCQNPNDTTWRYNLAFLYTYEGNLEEANEEYRHAFRGPIDNANVPIQCEDFIQNVLLEEPEKDQLYFALGLINYNAKNDYLVALDNFNRFLHSKTSEKYPEESKLVRDLVDRCKGKIKE